MEYILGTALTVMVLVVGINTYVIYKILDLMGEWE